MASEDWDSQVKLGRSLNRESSLLKEATADSGQYDYISGQSQKIAYSKVNVVTLVSFQGFQNKSVSETSLQAEEPDNVIEEVQLNFSCSFNACLF